LLDILEYVPKNVVDICITGVDMIAEYRSNVEFFLVLRFGYARSAFVVLEKS
jgi:ATP phosphoribosyltransferase